MDVSAAVREVLTTVGLKNCYWWKGKTVLLLHTSKTSKHFQLRAVTDCTARILAGCAVGTRQSTRNLTHAHHHVTTKNHLLVGGLQTRLNSKLHASPLKNP